MRHQLFETWLFEQDALSGEELHALQQHLAECEPCSTLATALRTVDQQLQAAPFVAPAADFSSRWRVRLLEDQRRGHQRQTIAIVLALTAGLIGLWIVAGAQALSWMQAMLPDVFTWLGKAADVISQLNMVREIWGVILGILMSGIPWIYRVGVPAILVVLALLWFSSIYRLGFVPIRRRV